MAKLLDNLGIDYLIKENDNINEDSSNMDRNSTNNNGTIQPNWIIVQVALCGPVYQEDIPNWVLILTTKIQVNLKTFTTKILRVLKLLILTGKIPVNIKTFDFWSSFNPNWNLCS